MFFGTCVLKPQQLYACSIMLLKTEQSHEKSVWEETGT